MATPFETKPCGRCGGSGKYSFNQMDGDRCYGCGGSGIVLTKRGTAAKAFYEVLLTKPITEIATGDSIFTTIGISNRRKWQKVIAVRPGIVETQSCSIQGFPSFMTCRTEEDRLTAVAEAVKYQATLTQTGTVRKVQQT